jgi:hypothetical protein
MGATAVGPDTDPSVGSSVGQRMIPEEPMVRLSPSPSASSFEANTIFSSRLLCSIVLPSTNRNSHMCTQRTGKRLTCQRWSSPLRCSSTMYGYTNEEGRPISAATRLATPQRNTSVDISIHIVVSTNFILFFAVSLGC